MIKYAEMAFFFIKYDYRFISKLGKNLQNKR